MNEILKAYRIVSVEGDKYAAGFVIEAFSRWGITYTYSERDRSQIYVDVLPAFTSARVRLVDNKKLVAQFSTLERRTSVSGRDTVDHQRGSHDDLCNAVAGAIALLSTGEPALFISDEVMEAAARWARRGRRYA
jgi:hypothetical protein